MTLLALALLSGMLTALAPCILPLLPVIIGGSLGDKKRLRSRPYIIAFSLAVSIFVFTLLLKASTVLIDIPSATWAIISGVIVIVLGLLTIWPHFWERVMNAIGVTKRGNSLLGKAIGTNGFVGAVLTGAALGPVFTSCSPTYGFIVATVVPREPLEGALYLAVYCIGLVGVLLLISLFGQRLLAKYPWAVNPMSAFRRGIGILFVVVGLFLISGTEKRFQTWLVERNPIDVTKLEMKLFGDRLNSMD